MPERKNGYQKDILLAIIVAVIGYMILLSTSRTGIVDISIKAVLFFIGSIIAFKGYSKSNVMTNKDFKKFQLFYGLTYLTVAISFIMGIYYFIKNPNVLEIEVADAIGILIILFTGELQFYIS